MVVSLKYRLLLLLLLIYFKHEAAVVAVGQLIYLIFLDFAHSEVGGVRVGKVQAGH